MARSAKLLPGMLLSKNISLVDLTASHRTVCILLHSPIGNDTGAKRLKRMGWHPSTANNLPIVSAMDLGDTSNICRSHKSALGAVQDTRQQLLWTDSAGCARSWQGTLRQTLSLLEKTCTYSRP